MNKKRRHKTRPRRTGQRISTIKTKNNEIVNFLCQFLCNKQYDDTRPGPDGPGTGFRIGKGTHLSLEEIYRTLTDKLFRE